MTKTEKEDIIIAQFMGGFYVVNKHNKEDNLIEVYNDAFSMDNTSIHGFTQNKEKGKEFVKKIRVADLQYHLSIVWLFPVLDKIRSLNPDSGNLWFEWQISYCHCRIWNNQGQEWKNNAGATTDAINKSIVEFLQWYNDKFMPV